MEEVAGLLLLLLLLLLLATDGCGVCSSFFLAGDWMLGDFGCASPCGDPPRRPAVNGHPGDPVLYPFGDATPFARDASPSVGSRGVLLPPGLLLSSKTSLYETGEYGMGLGDTGGPVLMLSRLMLLSFCSSLLRFRTSSSMMVMKGHFERSRSRMFLLEVSQ